MIDFAYERNKDLNKHERVERNFEPKFPTDRGANQDTPIFLGFVSSLCYRDFHIAKSDSRLSPVKKLESLQSSSYSFIWDSNDLAYPNL